jgi:phage terminase large subunit
MEIKLNKKYKPLFLNDSRYFMVTGGRGSSKSYSIASMILLLSYEYGHNILFTRYTMTSASTSIIPEMTEKIELLGLESDFIINKTDITNRLSGNKIYFRGLKTGSGNQTAALKSLSGITTWILDEAEEMPDEALFDKIDLSVRSKEAHNRVIMVMNPATKAHWIYNRFFVSRGLIGGENVCKGDTTYVHTTYKNNIKYLDRSFLANIAQMKSERPDEYEAQIIGGWRSTAEGVIFSNWELKDFDASGDHYGIGMDFGFSADPTGATLISINKNKKEIYLKELVYDQGLTTSDIASRLLKHGKSTLIIGDSAEPRLLHELRYSYGLNIKPSIKGQGSINLGIALLQEYNLFVHQGSVNLITELNNYRWKEGKEVALDSYNHLLDGIRYFVSYHLSAPNRGKYYIG